MGNPEDTKQELQEMLSLAMDVTNEAVVASIKLDELMARRRNMMVAYPVQECIDSLQRCVGDLEVKTKARNELSSAYRDVLSGEGIKLAEANLRMEVEAEFAASGVKSNAEQRKAELARRLADDPAYREAVQARRDAQDDLDRVGSERDMLDLQFKATTLALQAYIAMLTAGH
jgi:hypothetical protein